MGDSPERDRTSLCLVQILVGGEGSAARERIKVPSFPCRDHPQLPDPALACRSGRIPLESCTDQSRRKRLLRRPLLFDQVKVG